MRLPAATTLALVPLALLACTASTLPASTPAPVVAAAVVATAEVTTPAPASARRIIGDYSLGGGRVQVAITLSRVELFVQDADTRVAVLLDAPSVRWWLTRANALIASKEQNPSELQSPPLTNVERTVASTVVLTRAAHGAPGARFYVTAQLDQDRIAMLPLSKMDARIVTAALKRALEEMAIDQERAAAAAAAQRTR